MHLLAPAKINLHLRVGPLGADGYDGFHPLVSWMVTVGLFDTLIINRAHTGGTPREGGDLRLVCDDRTLPTGDRNIVVRAAKSLLVNEGEPKQDISIELRKRIPHGAGLGGGSSDAATTLLGLNELLDLRLGRGELMKIGAALGSDVPFFFAAPSAVCAGRGEIVRRTAPPRARWVVLMFPELGLSTARVYQAFDARPLGKAGDSAEPDWREQPDWQHWATLSSDALLPCLVNDLEPAAFAVSPPLAELRERSERAIKRIVRMSGSGSTLFTLFEDEPSAAAATEKLATDLRVRAMTAPLAPGFD